MTRYLLDTGIASDFINRRGLVPLRVRDARLQGNVIGIATPVLAELIAGIQNSNDPAKHLATLWRNVSEFTLWSFDKAAAIQFGRLYAETRRIGRCMQFSDLQIAAIAFTFPNCAVVSKDTDFSGIPGLITENWSLP